jgi:hypothetical protein
MALENRAAASALHPSGHEHPALFNGAVREPSRRGSLSGAEKFYIDSAGCAASVLAAEASE